jgi:hypothetical protein
VEPVSYTISKAQHLAFWKLQFDASLRRGLLILGLVVAALVLLALGAGQAEDAFSVAFGGVLGATIMILAMRFVMIPRQANKAWNEYALIKEEMTLTLGEESFTIDQKSGHVDAKWADMTAWDETDAIFAMFLTRQLAYLLPKDQVSDEHLEFARESLVDSGLAKARKRRK